MGWQNPKETFETFETFLAEKGFKVSPNEKLSIHNPNSVKFLEEIVMAEPWVVEVAREGVALNLKIGHSETYYEKNNKTARDNMPDLREKIRNPFSSCATYFEIFRSYLEYRFILKFLDKTNTI